MYLLLKVNGNIGNTELLMAKLFLFLNILTIKKSYN